MTIAQLLANPDFSEKYVLQKLIMEYLHCTREQMRTEGETVISDDLLNKIKIGYKAYVEEQKPLEYILGHVTFFGNEFKVNEHTLVPRPETEYMIQAVTEHIQSENLHRDTQNAVLMDIGTGCGVLGTSVLLQNPDAFRTAFITDISEDALYVAKENIDTHLATNKTEIRVIWTDLLAFAESYKEVWTNKPIVLVANLPYIPEAMFDQNAPDNVQKREPKMAFVGAEDGLLYYRQMLDQMPETMKPTITCFFEMMTRQVEILAKEYEKSRHFEEVKTFHFNIRIVKVVALS